MAFCDLVWSYMALYDLFMDFFGRILSYCGHRSKFMCPLFVIQTEFTLSIMYFRIRREFLEAEAELSGSEGSDDEDERGLDKLLMEEGDLDDIDEDAVRDQVRRYFYSFYRYYESKARTSYH